MRPVRGGDDGRGETNDPGRGLQGGDAELRLFPGNGQMTEFAES